MANELSMTVTLTYTPTDSPGEIVRVAPPAFAKTVTMSSNTYVTGTETVPQAGEQLLGDDTNGFAANVGTVGYVLIKNVDDTNYVQMGRTAGVYSLRLNAGEFALFRLDQTSSTIYALANTADVVVQYWVFAN